MDVVCCRVTFSMSKPTPLSLTVRVILPGSADRRTNACSARRMALSIRECFLRHAVQGKCDGRRRYVLHLFGLVPDAEASLTGFCDESLE